jgi:hypothetical protein
MRTNNTIVTMTKNSKNPILPYDENDVKLFKKLLDLESNLDLSGNVNIIIKYKKAKTVITIVNNIEYPKYF